jgi:hypothetical protein
VARDRWLAQRTIGFLSILHTWGQNLLHHPHTSPDIHRVVQGGGISPDQTRCGTHRYGMDLVCKVRSVREFASIRRIAGRSTMKPIEGSVALNGNRYSVPVDWIGRRVVI